MLQIFLKQVQVCVKLVGVCGVCVCEDGCAGCVGVSKCVVDD